MKILLEVIENDVVLLREIFLPEGKATAWRMIGKLLVENRGCVIRKYNGRELNTIERSLAIQFYSRIPLETIAKLDDLLARRELGENQLKFLTHLDPDTLEEAIEYLKSPEVQPATVFRELRQRETVAAKTQHVSRGTACFSRMLEAYSRFLNSPIFKRKSLVLDELYAIGEQLHDLLLQVKDAVMYQSSMRKIPAINLRSYKHKTEVLSSALRPFIGLSVKENREKFSKALEAYPYTNPLIYPFFLNVVSRDTFEKEAIEKFIAILVVYLLGGAELLDTEWYHFKIEEIRPDDEIIKLFCIFGKANCGDHLIWKNKTVARFCHSLLRSLNFSPKNGKINIAAFKGLRFYGKNVQVKGKNVAIRYVIQTASLKQKNKQLLVYHSKKG